MGKTRKVKRGKHVNCQFCGNHLRSKTCPSCGGFNQTFGQMLNFAMGASAIALGAYTITTIADLAGNLGD